jgi:hypothetical protein
MLPTGLFRLLTDFLWVTPHLLLGLLVVVLYKRRLYREFPLFCVYVFYEIAEFVLLLALYLALGTGKPYAVAYCATLLLSIALRFGVIDEVSKDLFRESRFLKGAALRALRCLTALLFGLGVLLAVYAPADNGAQWYAGVFVVNRGAALVQCGMLLALLLFSRFLGLSWRRYAFGIALGLGILTSMDLAMFALRAEFTSTAGVQLLNLLITGSYLICVLIWIGYLRAHEIDASPLAAPHAVLPNGVLPHEEVETWNTEFQHLVRR